MKRAIIVLMFLIISSSMFSQVSDSLPTLAKQDYLEKSISQKQTAENKEFYFKKSKYQKTIAWVLMGTGTAAIISGAINMSNARKQLASSDDLTLISGDGALLLGAGIVMAVGSIPVFIASGKSKRMAMSLSLQTQEIRRFNKNAMVKHIIPALSLRIDI